MSQRRRESYSRPCWLLLHGDDCERPAVRRVGGRVVLLHGWLQEHSAWLKTATALRDLYGHSVLLVDWYGHGHSPVAPSPESDSPAGYCALLEDRLAAIGWDAGLKLTVCGCSMGAAIAQRYACAHPDRVARLNLLCPPGCPESWFMPCFPVRAFAQAILAALPSGPLSRSKVAALLRVIQTTPQYGVDPCRVVELASGRDGCQITVYAAQLDIVHSPHAKFWRKAAEFVGVGGPKSKDAQSLRHDLNHGWSGAFAADATEVGAVEGIDVPANAAETFTSHVNGGDARRDSGQRGSLRYILFRGASHWWVCTHLFELGLHHDQSLWHAPLQASPPASLPLRAKL